MINMIEVILPIMISVSPFIVGAIKRYFASNLARVLADIVPPIVAALSVMYFLDILLVSTQVVTESHLTNIWYITGLATATILSGIGFYLAIGLGVKLAEKNYAGLQSDMERGTELAARIIIPSLERLLRKSREDTDVIMKNRNDALLSHIRESSDTITRLEKQLCNIQESVETQKNFIKAVYKNQQGIDSLLKSVKEYFETIPNLQDELAARIESIKALQEDVPDADGTSKTVLTPEDGRTNRAIGLKKQDEMAQALCDMGFGVKVGHGAGKPDCIIKKKGSKDVVAVGSNKAYSLYDEQGRMQRRITRKDCTPEIKLAARLKVPMALIVTNIVNDRRWISIVEPTELDDWKGESTPVMLAKDDETSGIELEEIFADGVVELGGQA